MTHSSTVKMWIDFGAYQIKVRSVLDTEVVLADPCDIRDLGILNIDIDGKRTRQLIEIMKRVRGQFEPNTYTLKYLSL